MSDVVSGRESAVGVLPVSMVAMTFLFVSCSCLLPTSNTAKGDEFGSRNVVTTGVACFKDESVPGSTDTRSLASDLRNSLESLLPSTYDGEIVKLPLPEAGCDDPESMYQLARNHNLGVVVAGSYRIDSGMVTLSPSVFVASDRFRLRVPGLVGVTQDYLSIKGRAANAIGEVLNALRSAESVRQVKKLADEDLDSEELLEAGYRLLFQDMIDVALLFFDKAARSALTESGSRDVVAEAHYNIGVVRLSRDEVPNAIDRFNSSLRADRTFTPARIGLIDAYTRAGRVEDARSAREQIPLDDSRSSAAYKRLGDAYTREGKYREAVRNYSEALKLGTTDDEARINLLISLLSESGRAERARRYEDQYKFLLEAYSYSPKFGDFRCGILRELAFAARSLHRFQEAHELIKRVVDDEQCEINATVLYQFAILQKNDGRVDLALESLREAEQISGGGERLNIQLVIAGYLIHAGRREEGLERFEAIRPQLETADQFVINLAWFYAVAEDREKFYANLEKALRYSKEDTIRWLDQEVDVKRYRKEERFKQLMHSYWEGEL